MIECVVGVDGGGSSTTAVVVDLDGTVRSAVTGGGANPAHNGLRDGHDAVQSAIYRALEKAGREPSSVTALTVGLAGLDDPSDRRWAEAFATLSDLSCEPVALNDAVVAHAGALRGEPGVVAICGTGSIVVGIDDEGRQIRNYDLDHYAEAAARHLGRRLVHRLVAGCWDEADRAFVDRVLSVWGLESVDAVRAAALEGDLLTTDESSNDLDTVAPLVTGAAAEGVPLAVRVCEAACDEVVTGIEAVAGYLDDEMPTRVALEGGVLRSDVMADRVAEGLAAATGHFEIVEPALTPATGAALLGLQRVTDCNEKVVSQLE